VTRGGAARDTVRLGNLFGAFQRSRDGRRLALGGFQLDLLDLDRRVTSTLIKPTTNRWLFQYPQWSPGDTAIAYMFRDSVNARIDVVNVRTGLTHALVSGFPPGRFPYLGDWSPDGRYIVYTLTAGGSENQEPWVYDLSTKQSRKLFDERGNVGPMQISPNGRFIAYEVLPGELYLRPFPGPGSAIRVTPGVGRYPHWRGDGRELFYVNEAGAIVAVGIREDAAVASTSEIAVAASVTRDLTSNAGSVSFEPSIDGKQFHVVYNRAPDAPALAIMTNWWKRAGFVK
jgi:Tol biopolymer transport system component